MGAGMPAEPGWDGVTVQLLNATSQGQVLQTAVTASVELDGQPGIDPLTERGLYTFADVWPGTYRVHELTPADSTQTAPLSGDYVVTVASGESVGIWPAQAVALSDPNPNWLDRVAAGNLQFCGTVLVDVNMDFDGLSEGVFDLSGLTWVALDAPADTNGDGVRDRIGTQLTDMSMHGTALFGPTAVRLGASPSLGHAQQTPGSTVADSFFEVYLEIDTADVFGTTLALHNTAPLPLHAVVERVPPYGAVYQDTLGALAAGRRDGTPLGGSPGSDLAADVRPGLWQSSGREPTTTVALTNTRSARCRRPRIRGPRSGLPASWSPTMASGTNTLSLSGADAALFEITADSLYLRAGTTLNHTANPVLDVTVEVDDPTVGTTPDDTAALAITVTPSPWLIVTSFVPTRVPASRRSSTRKSTAPC